MGALPPLYAITDPGAGMSHVEQVARFVMGGARLIQIRDKHAPGRDIYEWAVAALAITRSVGALLIVNDRTDVAAAAGVDGVHVGHDDLPADAARSIMGPDRIVGISTHNVYQVRDAETLPVDYIAIGPVFATATKENPGPVVGLDLVRESRLETRKPLVAIGGITLERAPDVLAAGADSVAVIGDLRVGSSLDERVAAYVAALGDSP